MDFSEGQWQNLVTLIERLQARHDALVNQTLAGVMAKFGVGTRDFER